ncbi:putative RING-H2 finger protein ATL21C [Bidens hawaiensis]|uniref:putative RING-H2 finger protein ATL21C n=1 Tax=Bidens hawaiensis TaxID=980011 RepID=UPI004048FCF5
MEKSLLRLIFFSTFLLASISATTDDCAPASCSPTEPLIRFPFRITNHHPSWCGYPGFNLYCSKLNKTIIQLPSSRSYIVNAIDYVSQAIYIDPDFCGRDRIHSLNITGTPFEFPNLQRYTFYNCSSQSFGYMYPAVPFPCLNSKNHSVVAVRPELYSRRNMPSNCKVMKAIAVPLPLNGRYEIGI